VNSGDLVKFKWIEEGILMLLSEFKQVDEPAWICINLKSLNIEWFYEFDLRIISTHFINKED
jgi:hypothetical protein